MAHVELKILKKVFIFILTKLPKSKESLQIFFIIKQSKMFFLVFHFIVFAQGLHQSSSLLISMKGKLFFL